LALLKAQRRYATREASAKAGFQKIPNFSAQPQAEFRQNTGFKKLAQVGC
jgi:hypothetical protein